jgi:hypothetical protein
MSSWVYIFSKFTPEALLFETFGICILAGSYAAFWILKKRRLGALGEDEQTSVVRTYMDELIAEAEAMRSQLFGMLGHGTVTAGGPTLSHATAPATPAQAPVASGTPANDPMLVAKIAEMEAKMSEQTRAMQALVGDKARVEQELTQAKAQAAGAPAAGGDNSANADLLAKIHVLEGKLAEYSVIEDDLANLKRLQQENTQLKAMLAGRSEGSAPAAADPAPAPAAAPAAAAPAAPAAAASAPEAQAAAPTPAPAAAAAPAAQAPAPAAEAAPAAPEDNIKAPASADAVFEGLVDQVEQSLQNEAAPGAAPATTNDKSDADLVAEFEKMLNT